MTAPARAPEDLRDIETRRVHGDSTVLLRQAWSRRTAYYNAQRLKRLRRLIRPGLKVLDIGCGTGDILAGLEPREGLGIDLSGKAVEIARARHPRLRFLQGDAENLAISETFDAVVLSDVVGSLQDVWRCFRELKKVSSESTRVVVTYYNFLWEPAIRLAERIGFKMPLPNQNWLPLKDLKNFLDLAGFDTVTTGLHVLLPVHVPVLSHLLNRYVAPLPLVNHLCLEMVLVARRRPEPRDYSVSVLIACRNEAGNIAPLVRRTPALGLKTEFLFIDGASTDGTVERIQEEIARGSREIRLSTRASRKGRPTRCTSVFGKRATTSSSCSTPTTRCSPRTCRSSTTRSPEARPSSSTAPASLIPWKRNRCGF
ncbi:MAG: methyltransferase domain-containing protein [Elusimicrobia bacterium]|nr:methyltransferase domain-containing protein [Elusimicrobiota bacterium]